MLICLCICALGSHDVCSYWRGEECGGRVEGGPPAHHTVHCYVCWGLGGLLSRSRHWSLVLTGSRPGCQSGRKPDAGPSGVYTLMVGRVGWGSMVPGLLLLQLCAHRLCPCWPRRGASAQEQISGPCPHLPILVGLSRIGLAMLLLLHLLDSIIGWFLCS